MVERTSFTNAAVSSAPAPMRNPRRDFSMKNPHRQRAHLEGLRPTVALAGHIVVATVADRRLVGGTVRSSQDARECISLPWEVSIARYDLVSGKVRPTGLCPRGSLPN